MTPGTKREKERAPSRLKPYCIGGLFLFMGFLTSIPFLARAEASNAIVIMLATIAIIGFFGSMVLSFVDYRYDYAKAVLIITTIFAGGTFFSTLAGTNSEYQRQVQLAELELSKKEMRNEKFDRMIRVEKLSSAALSQTKQPAQELPKELSIPIGKDQSMKFRLVPPGSFVIGANLPPVPTDVNMGLSVALVGGLAAWIWLLFQARSAAAKKRTMQFSLRNYFLLMLMLACVVGGFAWHTRIEQDWKKLFAAFAATNKDQLPAHEVLTSKPFYIAEAAVTPEQYAALVQPFVTADSAEPKHGVNWYNAQEFCRKLSVQSGRHFRLPTEAEWEYAQQIHGDAIKPKLFEWCADWFAPYEAAAAVDPAGSPKGFTRVARGGFDIKSVPYSSEHRDQFMPEAEHESLTFRVVCEAKQ